MSLPDPLNRIPRDLPSSAYKLGNEFKPFHPSASHVPPEARDAWNRCYVLAQNAIQEAVAKERMRCYDLVMDAPTMKEIHGLKGRPFWTSSCKAMAFDLSSRIREGLPPKHDSAARARKDQTP